MKKNLNSYIKRIPNFLSKDICNKTIKEIKKLKWQQHTFYDVKTNISKDRSGEQELEVSTNINNEGIDSKIIMGKLLVWLGNEISSLTCKLKCKWNWLLDKITFNVASCPQNICTCKK